MVPKKTPINTRSDITPDPKPLPLQTCETSVEIYLIIQELEKGRFTVGTIKEIMNTRYRTSLSPKRIRQVLDAMADRGRIVKTSEKHSYNNIPINVYQRADAPTILVDSPIYNIISIIYEKQQFRAKHNNSEIDQNGLSEDTQEVPIRKLA